MNKNRCMSLLKLRYSGKRNGEYYCKEGGVLTGYSFPYVARGSSVRLVVHAEGYYSESVDDLHAKLYHCYEGITPWVPDMERTYTFGRGGAV